MAYISKSISLTNFVYGKLKMNQLVQFENYSAMIIPRE